MEAGPTLDRGQFLEVMNQEYYGSRPDHPPQAATRSLNTLGGVGHGGGPAGSQNLRLHACTRDARFSNSAMISSAAITLANPFRSTFNSGSCIVGSSVAHTSLPTTTLNPRS